MTSARVIERSNEYAKDEIGWDEFQTRKYRVWNHQLALTILASWFVAETRFDWQQTLSAKPRFIGSV
jgi:SRSO17 transposase